ncbi:MAG: acyltransferase [Actinobacteria bacterium]|nr:MAG: acyltransferase [Actinomycetota bacterium]
MAESTGTTTMVMTRGRHSAPSRTGTRTRPRPAEKVYRPGLDGLRAVAVIGVLLYHAGVRWMPGGLLGVDLFFVISGFLITSLLITELQRSGRIALAGFYGRRARRLFPALAAVLALAVGAMALFRPGDLVRFRGDLLASVGYVANWWFIVKHQSYFVASGRPSPLQHLWSLAVEEQFYILWPLGLLALWRSLTRPSLAGAPRRTEARALTRVGWYAVAAACLSASWMAYIAFREDLPYGADSSRVYFGTDTHASGLLLGVAAAAFLAARYGPLWQRRPGRAARKLFDLAGVAALVAVSWAMLRASEFSPGLYRGGFLLFAAAAAVAVTAASRPGGFLAWVLGSKPGRWIGTRSYGLYLWHWPVFVYTRPQLDVPLTGTANVVLRLALTVILAELSYRLVERPLRNLRWRDWRAVNLPWRRVLATVTMGAGVALGSAGVLSLGYAVYQIGGQPAHRKSLAITSSSSHVVPDAHTAASLVPPAPSSAPTATASPSPANTPSTPSASPPASPSPAPPPLPDGHNVTAIGDSVMLGAEADLAEALPGATVDAVEGRQASSAFSLIDGLVNTSHLGADVVLHIGTNGTIDPQALDTVLTLMAERRHPNVALLDWNTAASAHPEWLWNDGIHLRPAGAAAYRDLILDALRHEG